MAEYVFHVLHNARPEYERDVLTILLNGLEFTYEGILSTGKAMGLRIGSQVNTERMLKDILQPLRDLNLLEHRRIKLTGLGQQVACIASEKSNLFTEIFHYLYYSAWREQDEAQKCFSWSYRALCNHLWQQNTAFLDKKSLASFISLGASQRFHREDVSVSTNTVNGILVWLEALSPPVISLSDMRSGAVFTRRAFCAPELFVLGVDFVYQTEGIDYGANMLLNEDRRDAICQVCLLDPSCFDRVLEYATAQFEYLKKGIGGGWGRYLALRRSPELEDFA